ncbi:hypothetical protein AAY473_007328 [Plecturocebus cupreus]
MNSSFTYKVFCESHVCVCTCCSSCCVFTSIKAFPGPGKVAVTYNPSTLGGEGGRIMRSRDRDHPAQHGETLSLQKLRKLAERDHKAANRNFSIFEGFFGLKHKVENVYYYDKLLSSDVMIKRVWLCLPGWSIVSQSQLTVASISRTQTNLLPQHPEATVRMGYRKFRGSKASGSPRTSDCHKNYGDEKVLPQRLLKSRGPIEG